MAREEKNRHPKISVVIPVLNQEKYIGQALDSMLSQNYKNLEIIIKDGGSIDKTINIVNAYKNKHPKLIKLIKGKDNGQYDAINIGFNNAGGEILAFLNADDIYAENAFNRIVSAYNKNKNSLWFVGQGAVINEKDEEISKFVTLYKNILLKLNNYNLLLMVNYIMQPSVFLSKQAYKKYGPFKGTKKFLREYDLWMKLGQVKMPVVIDQTLSYFRLSKNMISASKFKEIAEDDLITARKYSSSYVLLSLRRLHNSARALFLP